MNAFRQRGEEVSEDDQLPVPSTQTADQLRAEFDRTFALPARQPTGKARDFVILQVAGQTFALAALDLRSIERTGSRDHDRDHGGSSRLAAEDAFSVGSWDRLESRQTSAAEWVRVPSTQPALLGIRSFSGRIVPVFTLSILLGLHSTAKPTHCALVADGEDLIGFAFDALLRFARIEPENIFSPGAASHPWEEAALSDAGAVFPVIGMAALLRMLANDPSQPEAGENPLLRNGKS